MVCTIKCYVKQLICLTLIELTCIVMSIMRNFQFLCTRHLIYRLVGPSNHNKFIDETRTEALRCHFHGFFKVTRYLKCFVPTIAIIQNSEIRLPYANNWILNSLCLLRGQNGFRVVYYGLNIHHDFLKLFVTKDRKTH